MPPMHMRFDLLGFAFELVYTLIIMIFCALIFLRTKEIYDLSKHKGIKHFRYTFLFFGLAYAFRFLLQLFLLYNLSLGIRMPGRYINPLMSVPVSYFGTLALLYLLYSLFWRSLRNDVFIIVSNALALVVSLLAFFLRTHIVIPLVQLVLLGIIVIVWSFAKKKISRIDVLYLLLILFWILNLLVLGPRRLLPFEVSRLLQLISVLVFIWIYYKVLRWTK